MEKRKPHFALKEVKAAFSNADVLNRSFVSKRGADLLGLDDVDVVAVVQALEPSDFVKSMTSFADPRIWQDVYMPVVTGRKLYVKFTVDSNKSLFLISFKGKDE